MRHRMIESSTEIAYGGQVGTEYPLTPDPMLDLDPARKNVATTPRLDSVGVVGGQRVTTRHTGWLRRREPWLH